MHGRHREQRKQQEKGLVLLGEKNRRMRMTIEENRVREKMKTQYTDQCRGIIELCKVFYKEKQSSDANEDDWVLNHCRKGSPTCIHTCEPMTGQVERGIEEDIKYSRTEALIK